MTTQSLARLAVNEAHEAAIAGTDYEPLYLALITPDVEL